MKIEMGESLFYSWLRHVKECQVVQTNWKVSPQWQLQHENELSALMLASDRLFSEKYGYHIYKKNSSLSQLIQQGECDALGIAFQSDSLLTYAVDVAFHEAGLNYGSREETVMAVVKKSLRTAMCIYGYMDTKQAEIVFASPKINPAVLADLEPCYADINVFFRERGFDFSVRIIANDEFNDSVLKPILLVSEGVSDTNELFLRGYQMFNMFSDSAIPRQNAHTATTAAAVETGAAKELKVGKLAQVVLRRILQEDSVSEDEVRSMQTAEYSKRFFDIQYPLLVEADSDFDRVRYYARPLLIRGKQYYLCSQWFETSANNDRPYLVKWINEHGGLLI